MKTTPGFNGTACRKLLKAGGIHQSLIAAVALAVGAAASSFIQAQTLNVSAQIRGQDAGGGSFDYTITLNNSASSTDPVETFWYSWVPGADFLPSNPLTLNAPTGWGATVTHLGASDGFGIQFTTTTSPLAPGSSMDFGFSSSDTPAVIAGDSPFFPGNPVGTSYVYSGAPFSGNSAQFVVASVPEPDERGLLCIGGIGVLIAELRRRNRRRLAIQKLA